MIGICLRYAECNMAVLYSYPGSVAGKYAEEHNMLYGELDRADVNGDWYVDVIDAMDIQKLATGKISSFDEVQCEFWMCK